MTTLKVLLLIALIFGSICGFTILPVIADEEEGGSEPSEPIGEPEPEEVEEVEVEEPEEIEIEEVEVEEPEEIEIEEVEVEEPEEIIPPEPEEIEPPESEPILEPAEFEAPEPQEITPLESSKEEPIPETEVVSPPETIQNPLAVIDDDDIIPAEFIYKDKSLELNRPQDITIPVELTPTGKTSGAQVTTPSGSQQITETGATLSTPNNQNTAGTKPGAQVLLPDNAGKKDQVATTGITKPVTTVSPTTQPTTVPTQITTTGNSGKLNTNANINSQRTPTGTTAPTPVPTTTVTKPTATETPVITQIQKGEPTPTATSEPEKKGAQVTTPSGSQTITDSGTTLTTPNNQNPEGTKPGAQVLLPDNAGKKEQTITPEGTTSPASLKLSSEVTTEPTTEVTTEVTTEPTSEVTTEVTQEPTSEVTTEPTVTILPIESPTETLTPEPTITPQTLITPGPDEGLVSEIQEVERTQELQQNSGILDLADHPGGVEVYVDAVPQGETPVIIEGLIPGRHIITFEHETGYEEKEVEIPESGGRVTLPVSEPLNPLSMVAGHRQSFDDCCNGEAEEAELNTDSEQFIFEIVTLHTMKTDEDRIPYTLLLNGEPWYTGTLQQSEEKRTKEGCDICYEMEDHIMKPIPEGIITLQVGDGQLCAADDGKGRFFILGTEGSALS